MIEIGYALLSAIQFFTCVFGTVQVWRFAEDQPKILDRRAFERYKGLARIQMFMALFLLVLMIPTLLLAVLLVIKHGFLGLGVVIVINLGVMALGKIGKGFEERVRDLEVAEEFQEEYDQVSTSWVEKPFPDF